MDLDIAVTYAGKAGLAVEKGNRACLPSVECHTYCCIPRYTCLYMSIGLYPLYPQRVGVIAMHGNAQVRLRDQHTLTTSVVVVVVDAL